MYQTGVHKKLAGHLDDAYVSKETCYFCGNRGGIGFKEHYFFCPYCSAIYTSMIVQRKSCNHITKDTPVTERPPWFKVFRLKPHILTVNGNVTQKCSICSKSVLADGW